MPFPAAFFIGDSAHGNLQRAPQKRAGIILARLKTGFHLRGGLFRAPAIKHGIKSAVRALQVHPPTHLHKDFGADDEHRKQEKSTRIESPKHDRRDGGGTQARAQVIDQPNVAFALDMARAPAKRAEDRHSGVKNALHHIFSLPAKSPETEARFCGNVGFGYTVHMSTLRTLPILLAFGLVAAFHAPAVHAEEGVEELSYQDLVDQLKAKRKKVAAPRASHRLDDIDLHASIAMATTFSNYRVGDRSMTRGMNGFQIGLGIDLFTPQWMAELALRNFGTRESGTESHALREVDLKVMHRQSLGSRLGFRAGTGLSTRYIRFSDPVHNISVSEESPNLIIAGGLDSILTEQVNVGAELSVRTALVDQSLDRNSADLMIRLETSF